MTKKKTNINFINSEKKGNSMNSHKYKLDKNDCEN